jgi:FAD/FMN-containing dehydrogenase
MAQRESGDGLHKRIDRRAFLAAAGVAGVAVAIPGAADLADARRRRRRPLIGAVPQRLEQAMRGHVFERGQPGYNGARLVYNERFDFVMPQAVARPIDAADVQGAVRWAVARGVPLRARSGGHSYEGYSTVPNGVMLDLRKMKGISVDHHARTATIGAGAQLIDVYSTLAGHGATIPAGSCPSVGIAGVTLGGGMGLAGRAFGLTTDNVVSLKIVTSDGHLRTADKHTNPDLFWALRGGGGGNFGVVTQFTFRIHPLPSRASYFNVSFPWSSASEAIAAWQAWAPHATDRLTSVFHLNAAPGSNSVSANGQYLGPAGDLGSLLAPLRAVPGASVSSVQEGYLNLQMLLAGCAHMSLPSCHTVGTATGGTLPRMSFRAKSDYVTHALPGAARQKLISAIETRASQPGSGAILFDSYGGAINRVAADATAFVHRSALFCIQYLSYNGPLSWLEQARSGMHAYTSGQCYQNYIDRDLPHWQQAYYGSNYSRLKSIRRAIDPDHFFNFPQAIGR